MTANIKYQRKLMIISTLAIIIIVRNLWERCHNRRLIQMPGQVSRHQSIDIPERAEDEGPKAVLHRQATTVAHITERGMKRDPRRPMEVYDPGCLQT
jgi:hypothetical protein